MNSKIILGFVLSITLILVAVPRVAAENLKDSGDLRYDPEFYKAMLQVASCCEVFNNYSLMDMKNYVDTISSWEVPVEIQQKFPYYQAGYDADGRPVWVLELGKFNFKEQVLKGEGENLEKHFDQASISFLEAGHRAMKHDGPNGKITQALAIVDLDKFQLTQFTHIPTVSFLVKTFRIFSHFIDAGLHKAILINVDFDPEFVSKYGGMVVGPLVSKLEVHRKKDEWEPILKKLIPQESLPAWYGGSEDFKPVKVYG